MQTEIGRSEYPLPDGFGRFRQVSLRMGDYYLELCPISPLNMKTLRNKDDNSAMPMFGVPSYYAVTDKMQLWPTPSGEWEVARCWEGAHQCRPR